MRAFSVRRRRTIAAAAGAALLAGCRPADQTSNTTPPDPSRAQGGSTAELTTDRALRLDLRHATTRSVDEFQLVRLRAEANWSGGKPRLRDPLDLGDYRLSVFDTMSGALLYRTGFDSPADSGAAAAATTLSVRAPMPAKPARATIEKRRAGSVFQIVWEHALDPGAAEIDAVKASLMPHVGIVFAHGPSPSKVDVAIVSEGYRSSEYAKFVADAKRAADYLFSVEPFAARIHDFNVRALFTPSAQSGATDSHLGIRKETAFRTAYGAGETERTLAVHDHHALYEAASAVPYDFLLVIVNARRYGGSAFFGGPAVVAIDSAAAKYLVLHEFAHVIGGLADEYYVPSGDGPAYRGNVEPWHPNVTISTGAAKWRASLAEGSRDPRPWNKAEYDRYFADYVKRYQRLRASAADESLVEKFMMLESKRQSALLSKNTAPRRVGLFEGANGYARRMFRSQVNCIMFSLQTEYFCAACTSAIERMISAHAA